jgi:hypothetical protein
MIDEPLPPDLRKVEQEIVSWMRFTPSEAEDHRIIGAVHDELRRERIAARWIFAARLTAGVFLWLHLSFYVASITDFHFSDAPPVMPVNPWAAGVQGILPDRPSDGSRSP